MEKGEEALEMLSGSGYEKLRSQAWEKGTVCHGEYNQHNILILGRETAVVNFNHWGFDIQMADLYRFMRKILEKYNWDSGLAGEMLECYSREQPISPEEWRYLQIRFTYPDKYWKIANYYYSHNKAWISEKIQKSSEPLSGRRNVGTGLGGNVLEGSFLFRENRCIIRKTKGSVRCGK